MCKGVYKMSDLKKILYAEDEPDIRTIVEIAVQATSPCEIRFAENGKEVLDIVGEYTPDLILLDVMMPEMDGPTTLKELRKNPQTKNIPVIFITAKAQVHELEVYKSYEILGIISKPFDPMQLYSNICLFWDNIHV